MLYADDTVIFANNEENLQRCLNDLQSYCKKWKLKVNSEKTKVIVFSKRKMKVKPVIELDGLILEVVDEFKYLGVQFKFNTNFKSNRHVLKGKALRAFV